MNPGMSEEVGKTARGLIESLGQTPLLLSLVVLNLATVGFMFYYVGHTIEQRTTSMDELFKGQDKIYTQWIDVMKNQQELSDKLLHCVPVDDVRKMVETIVPIIRPPQEKPPP